MLIDPVRFKTNEDLKPVFGIAVDLRDRRERKDGVWSKVAHEHFRFSYAPAMLSCVIIETQQSTRETLRFRLTRMTVEVAVALLQSNNHVTW